MKTHIIQLCVTALLLGQAALIQASDKSVTVFPAEGNKQCSDYSANSLILQMGANNPAASGSLLGAENPRDAGATGESATYIITNGNVASFSGATTPIDYAILKAGNKISVMIYPSGGVTSDANMKLLVANQPQTITAINLCYGLGNSAPPPPPAATIPACTDLSQGIDGVAIICPSSGQPSIVYNFEIDKPFYNTTGSPIACVCNSTALIECDPSVPYDAQHPTNGACPLPVGDKSGAEVTTHIELNNDPYACTTVGGIRKCYSY